MTWEEGLERLDRLAAAAAAARVAVLRVEEPNFFAEVRRNASAVPGLAAVAVSEPAAVVSMNGSSHSPAEDAQMLRSDLVGVVRLARPVVVAGTKVDPERDLAYVEALGIRTPIRAGADGIVAEVLVEDGQAVDFGQPLFAVRPEA
jgi:acetyl-CoA carboxylase biotin carboxyl carrier protein